MKIEVVSFTGNSGLTDYSVSLARALARSVSATVVTGHSLPARCDGMGFEVERLFRRSRYYAIDVFRFMARVLRRRPEWLLFQGPLKIPVVDGLVVRLLRRWGIGTAVTVHDVLPHYPKPWSRMEYGYYYRSFDRVVVHSEAARDAVRGLGVKAPVLTVPHGIYDIFNLTGISRADARKKIGGLSDDDYVVLFFGNLQPRKGLMEFLQAAEAMSGRGDVKFLIAGGNRLAAHGRAYVERLESARRWPNVIVRDEKIPFEEVENYFAASDVVALPYREGTTSGVLKLALAFGVPVVATRVGDFPEQVPPGAGVFIEADDDMAASLCRAVEQIKMRHEEFAREMVNARQHAQWPDIADRIIAYLGTK